MPVAPLPVRFALLAVAGRLYFPHDLFGKPLPTFPDHAPLAKQFHI
jgi:hypothetical protein